MKVRSTTGSMWLPFSRPCSPPSILSERISARSTDLKRFPAKRGSIAHESPRSMTVPLIVLAVCSAVVGIYFEVTHGFGKFLSQTPSIAYLSHHTGRACPRGISLGRHAHQCRGSGLWESAWRLCSIGPRGRPPLIRLTRQRGHWGCIACQSRNSTSMKFTRCSSSGPSWGLAAASYWIDRNVIDRTVNLVGRMPPAIGATLRPLQNGLVPFYAVGMIPRSAGSPRCGPHGLGLDDFMRTCAENR